jgi:hypothetical protein
MKLLDYTFYLMYRVLLKLGRVDWDAKMGITFFFSVCNVLLIIIISSLLGIIIDNDFSKIITHRTTFMAFWIITFLLSLFIYYLRYYKITNIECIERKWKAQNKKHKTQWKIISLLLIVIIPIFTFVTYRLYKYGYV